MAVTIKFDTEHSPLQPTLFLANRSGKIFENGYIPAVNISVSDAFNSKFDLQFKVNKLNNGEECLVWDKIEDFRLVWCREWDVWFEIYVSVQDDNDTVKDVTGVSIGEAELSQVNLYNIEINTEDDIARDDYSSTVLYNADKPSASLLHRITEKVPHYTIKYVAPSVANIQRTFSFDDKSIYDAFQEIAEEIDCLFVIDSGTADDGSIARSISVYDLESYCTDCGERGDFYEKCTKCSGTNILPGYGEDTTVHIGTQNLADSITLKTDTGSVKNCFRLEGGDDLMTATIMGCNPNGSQYLWYLSDDMKADMSDELQAKLASYDELYNYYNNEYEMSMPEEIRTAYNNLITKYSTYNTSLAQIPETITGYPNLINTYYDTIDLYLYLNDALMPSPQIADTNATEQAALLTSAALSPVAVQDLSKCSSATASSAVLSMAKTIIDPRFQVKVKNGTLSETTWTGNFTVTNYSDDTDAADSATVSVVINDDYETFTKQKIDKVLKKADNNSANDITSLFALGIDLFKAEIKKYCLTSLTTFLDAGQSCIDILIEQGVADRKTWANKDPDLYSKLYIDYYNKLLALQEEVSLREKEIEIITGVFDSDGTLSADGMQTILLDEKTKIQNALDMESYLGSDLWLELVSYRREDTYSNDNYISDGLNNAELFRRALEFMEVARKDAFKSATLQHSISASLKDLLVIEGFEPFVEHFAVGNWIRVDIDDQTWRLRLISYTIDYDNLDGLSVEFSDVKRYANGVDDTKSIIDQAESMASSYDSVSRQASQGDKGNKQLQDWVSNGLSLTKMKIVDSADNQNVSWDSHGILCREYRPVTDDYSEKQLKIINRGLYLTDDNWLTSKAGIGDFTYFNPETKQYEEAYGVIADTLIGNLILSERVGVYNEKNSITLGENGLTITADATADDSNQTTMTIQRKDITSSGEEVLTPLMYIDSDGNLVLTGSLRVQASSDSNIKTINDLCDSSRLDDRINSMIHAESQNIYVTIDSRYQALLDSVTAQLNDYKAEVGQYLQFNDDGLTLGASSSDFKTLIDNRGMYFREGNVTVAYINNNQLHIPNAVIEESLALGKFFFSPHSNGDGGVSLVWKG